jgi:hypothetical protein
MKHLRLLILVPLIALAACGGSDAAPTADERWKAELDRCASLVDEGRSLVGSGCGQLERLSDAARAERFEGE